MKVTSFIPLEVALYCTVPLVALGSRPGGVNSFRLFLGGQSGRGPEVRHSWHHFRQSSLASKFSTHSTLSWKFSSFILEILVNIRFVFRPFSKFLLQSYATFYHIKFYTYYPYYFLISHLYLSFYIPRSCLFFSSSLIGSYWFSYIISSSSSLSFGFLYSAAL